MKNVQVNEREREREGERRGEREKKSMVTRVLLKATKEIIHGGLSQNTAGTALLLRVQQENRTSGWEGVRRGMTWTAASERSERSSFITSTL